MRKFHYFWKNSYEYPKPNYKLKIKDGKDLYGRSQFKLRSDFTEPPFLRTKLVSDIHNRLGLPSISSYYMQLYFNDEYMGLYIITDIYKLSWAEKVFNDKDAKNLYKCIYSQLKEDDISGCENENSDVTDQSEWVDFLKKN